jgi:hypothetical protein
LLPTEALEADAPDEATFCQIPRERRFGFAWKEFQETRHYVTAPRFGSVATWIDSLPLSPESDEDGQATRARPIVPRVCRDRPQRRQAVAFRLGSTPLAQQGFRTLDRLV